MNVLDGIFFIILMYIIFAIFVSTKVSMFSNLKLENLIELLGYYVKRRHLWLMNLQPWDLYMTVCITCCI
ncbi:hypothetical protein HanPI659440_Chr05g0210871 [Helianthus annuus]|nr:hypothetical protein HanPI659440_Chr05g0210871 [Helianthus annuus]